MSELNPDWELIAVRQTCEMTVAAAKRLLERGDDALRNMGWDPDELRDAIKKASEGT